MECDYVNGTGGPGKEEVREGKVSELVVNLWVGFPPLAAGRAVMVRSYSAAAATLNYPSRNKANNEINSNT